MRSNVSEEHIASIFEVNFSFFVGVEFKVRAAIALKVTVFLDVRPRSPANEKQCFGGAYRLHRHHEADSKLCCLCGAGCLMRYACSIVLPSNLSRDSSKPQKLHSESRKLARTAARNRLCGLVVRAPGYRSTGPDFDSRRYKISE
jgi:hypothetical protein